MSKKIHVVLMAMLLALTASSRAWYDPSTRSFLSRDPQREVGGVNLYAYCFNQPLDYCDPTGGKPQLISQSGIGNAARIVNGVPQVHYSDYANWWSPLTDGATTDWWQSPTNDELARLFQPTAGGYRLASTYERSAVWDQQMATALPEAMQNAQATTAAVAKLSGGGLAMASGVGALYMGGTVGVVLAGHEFYAAGSNWLGAVNGTDYPTTPEGLIAQSSGASDGVVTGVDIAALPLFGTVRVARPTGTFEIMDGVRRTKAASLAGHSTIPAQIMEQGRVTQTVDLPLGVLLSPKFAIDISNPANALRWRTTLTQTQAGSPVPPILVYPGSQGTRIHNVFLDGAGGGF